jgi:hypothetical protein
MDENLEFGPFEDFNEVFNNLTVEERRNLLNIHINYTQEFSENHIITLMSNSVVGRDDQDEHERFELVLAAYRFLNQIGIIKLILQVVAASKCFKIIFDFNRESIRFMDPTTDWGTNGICYFVGGKIFIAAKNLLNPEKIHEIYGVIAHELCHYAMFLTFENRAIPYYEEDENAVTAFNEVKDI